MNPTDPLLTLSPQSLAGIMQQMKMKQMMAQQSQQPNQQQPQVDTNALGLWGMA